MRLKSIIIFLLISLACTKSQEVEVLHTSSSNSERLPLIENKKIKNVEGKKAAIFGAGEHSAQLIKSANIDLSKIDYFLDNDPNKQGEKFFGLPIHSPKIIQKGLLELILISSYDYQEEISDIIRKYDSTVEVVKFYEKVIAYNTYQDTTS